jgi:hypothetical protein
MQTSVPQRYNEILGPMILIVKQWMKDQRILVALRSRADVLSLPTEHGMTALPTGRL